MDCCGAMAVNGQAPGGNPAAIASPSLLVFTTTAAVTDATPLDLFAGQVAPEPATATCPALTRGGIEWNIEGFLFNNSGAARTITLTVLFGGVTLYEDTSQAMNANATARVWKSNGKITRKSTTTGWLGAQFFGNNGSPTGPATGIGPFDAVGTGLSPAMPWANAQADVGGLDWTVPQRLEFRVSWSAAVANLSFGVAGGHVGVFGS